MTKLSLAEKQLLSECCQCDPGKGVAVSKEERKVARALTRKGLSETWESVFMVCIATDKGRALYDQLTLA